MLSKATKSESICKDLPVDLDTEMICSVMPWFLTVWGVHCELFEQPWIPNTHARERNGDVSLEEGDNPILVWLIESSFLVLRSVMRTAYVLPSTTYWTCILRLFHDIVLVATVVFVPYSEYCMTSINDTFRDFVLECCITVGSTRKGYVHITVTSCLTLFLLKRCRNPFICQSSVLSFSSIEWVNVCHRLTYCIIHKFDPVHIIITSSSAAFKYSR